MEADHADLELPDPTAADTWQAFTTCLRELHRRCGRPTYEALSARTGLPKSAISYLVRRNPVRTPTESTVLRFVEGCVGFAGYDAAAARRERDRWRAAHQRLVVLDADALSAGPTSLAQEPPGPEATSPRSGTVRRRGLAALVGAAGLVALVLAITLGSWNARPGASARPGEAAAPTTALPVGASTPASPTGSGSTSSSVEAAAGPQAGVRCVERAEPQSDARLRRDWPTVFYCPNHPTKVFAWPHDDGRPIADLESRSSWFVCWTQGRSRDGRPEVFYYTQGDSTWRRPELDAWGFVPASSVEAGDGPAAGLVRPCSFRTTA